MSKYNLQNIISTISCTSSDSSLHLLSVLKTPPPPTTTALGTAPGQALFDSRSSSPEGADDATSVGQPYSVCSSIPSHASSRFSRRFIDPSRRTSQRQIKLTEKGAELVESLNTSLTRSTKILQGKARRALSAIKNVHGHRSSTMGTGASGTPEPPTLPNHAGGASSNSTDARGGGGDGSGTRTTHNAGGANSTTHEESHNRTVLSGDDSQYTYRLETLDRTALIAELSKYVEYNASDLPTQEITAILGAFIEDQTPAVVSSQQQAQAIAQTLSQVGVGGGNHMDRMEMIEHNKRNKRPASTRTTKPSKRPKVTIEEIEEPDPYYLSSTESTTSATTVVSQSNTDTVSESEPERQPKLKPASSSKQPKIPETDTDTVSESESEPQPKSKPSGLPKQPKPASRSNVSRSCSQTSARPQPAARPKTTTHSRHLDVPTSSVSLGDPPTTQARSRPNPAPVLQTERSPAAPPRKSRFRASLSAGIRKIRSAYRSGPSNPPSVSQNSRSSPTPSRKSGFHASLSTGLRKLRATSPFGLMTKPMGMPPVRMSMTKPTKRQRESEARSKAVDRASELTDKPERPPKRRRAAASDKVNTGPALSSARQAYQDTLKPTVSAPIEPGPSHWYDSLDEDIVGDDEEEKQAAAAQAEGADPPRRKRKPSSQDIHGYEKQILTTAKMLLFVATLVEGAYQTRAWLMRMARAVFIEAWRTELPELDIPEPSWEIIQVMVNSLSAARGQVKLALRPIIESGLHFQKWTASPEVIDDNLDIYANVHPNNFHCTEFDPPYGHYESDLLTHAIATALFNGPYSIGAMFNEYFNPMPLTTVAFILAVMQFCIEEWASGQHKPQDLKTGHMLNKYVAHYKGLKEARAGAKGRMRRLQEHWYEFGFESSGAIAADEPLYQQITLRSDIRPDTPISDHSDVIEAQRAESITESETESETEPETHPDGRYTAKAKGKGRA